MCFPENGVWANKRQEDRCNAKNRSVRMEARGNEQENHTVNPPHNRGNPRKQSRQYLDGECVATAAATQRGCHARHVDAMRPWTFWGGYPTGTFVLWLLFDATISKMPSTFLFFPRTASLASRFVCLFSSVSQRTALFSFPTSFLCNGIISDVDFSCFSKRRCKHLSSVDLADLLSTTASLGSHFRRRFRLFSATATLHCRARRSFLLRLATASIHSHFCRSFLLHFSIASLSFPPSLSLASCNGPLSIPSFLAVSSQPLVCFTSDAKLS